MSLNAIKFLKKSLNEAKKNSKGNYCKVRKELQVHIVVQEHRVLC